MKPFITRAIGAVVVAGSVTAAGLGLTATGAEAKQIQWSASRCARVENAAFDSLRLARSANNDADRRYWLGTAAKAMKNLAQHC